MSKNNKLARTSGNNGANGANEQAFNVEESAIAKRGQSSVASSSEFQAPANPEIKIQSQQRDAAQGASEFAQGQAAAHKVVTTQAYQFKQGFAQGINDAMPTAGKDVAAFVEEGEASVANFFSEFTASILGS